MSTVDFATYVQPTRFDASNGVMTGIRLIKAKPSDMSARERAALTEVREATVTVQDIAKLRDRLRPVNLKDEDKAFDASWGAVHAHLVGWARLDYTPPGKMAAELLTSLFPDGLAFLTRSYEEEWVESKRRLDRIDEEGLEESLTTVVHPDLLTLTREAHDALGQGLGVGDTPFEIPDGKALYESLRKLSLAVATYARVLAGTVDDRDEASVERFKKAMAPLDAHRAATRRSAGDDDEDVREDAGGDVVVEPTDPAAPVPDVDAPVVDEPVPPVS